jgi:hypothetical protein
MLRVMRTRGAFADIVDVRVAIEPMPDNPAGIPCRLNLVTASAEIHSPKV